MRSHLHFATGRPEERLTFDLQPEIARRMGYGDRGDAPAVERFMRRYFLIAKEVGALTRVFAAKLEAERVKSRPTGISRLLPRRRPKSKPLDEPGFHEIGGRLGIDGPETFERDPVNLLRLFKIADERNLDLHPDAFTAATRAVNLITSASAATAAAGLPQIWPMGATRSGPWADDRGGGSRPPAGFGRIVADAVQHVPLLHGGRAHAPGRGRDRRHRRWPLTETIRCRPCHAVIADREALFLAMLLRHRQGQRSADRRRPAGRISACDGWAGRRRSS